MDNLINKIHHADCLEFMKQLPDGSVDMILTDPPYGIDYLSNRTDNHKKIENDKFDDFNVECDKWLDEFYRLIKPTGCCCCCCGGGGKTPVSQIFTLKAIEKGFNLIQTVIWDKLTIGLGWKYRPSYETVVVLSKSKTDYEWHTQRKDISNIVHINNIIPQKGEHPTPKPVSLMEHFLELHSKEGDIVLEPFSGGGTTAIACHNMKRNFIAVEKDQEYYNYSVKRLSDHQKQLNLF